MDSTLPLGMALAGELMIFTQTYPNFWVSEDGKYCVEGHIDTRDEAEYGIVFVPGLKAEPMQRNWDRISEETYPSLALGIVACEEHFAKILELRATKPVPTVLQSAPQYCECCGQLIEN